MNTARGRRSQCLAFGLLVILMTNGCAVNTAEFASEWARDTHRIWVGPEYCANRLQDWQIRDGRLECVEASVTRPLRTVHLLTRRLGEKPGTVSMSVRTGAIEPGGKPTANTWTGFLIGAGGEDVDYRISSLVQHLPADDGGMLAVMDGLGKVMFRDNSIQRKGGVYQVVPAEAWPEFKITSSEGQGLAGAAPEDIELRLKAEPIGKHYRLTLSAHDHKTGTLISRATVENISPEQMSGNVALVSHLSASKQQKGKPAQGYWFRDWHLSGSKVVAHDHRIFGPVLCAQHTLSDGVLKMTAQMGPLGKQDTQTAQLQVRHGKLGPWRTVAEATLVDHSYTFPFRVEDWDATRDTPYRIAYTLRTGADSTKTYYYQGVVRKEPIDQDTFVVAAFTGNHIHAIGDLHWNNNGIWFPHTELVEAVTYHNPDFLFFSGDQIYEGDLVGCQKEPLDKAILDYLNKWYWWCWAYKELARNTPCVCIPDDHDVYHGNLWGCGGRKAKNQDDGGYLMDPVFVNMVERTQASHLPDPIDPRPIEQGIGVYFTNIDYGGISFAVIEDRKFKSSPTVSVPEGKFVNGWPQNPDFDAPTQADVPGAVLLGDRQLAFLKNWAADWAGGIEMKVALSQTIFSNVATVPTHFKTDGGMGSIKPVAYGVVPKIYKLAVDGDSNGWPQTGRNKALHEMRRAFAFHIAGDQHLGITAHYGIDDWNDAGYALCVPAIGNLFPRRWYPPTIGQNRKPDSPKYTGEFKDGFGNYITVDAVSNPVASGLKPARLYDRAVGYGIVRLNKAKRTIAIECWPRHAKPADPDITQYPGWPVNITQEDNYGRKAKAYLPTIQVQGMTDPVVQVIDEADADVVYTIRIKGTSYQPKVFKSGSYTIRVGEPGTARMKTLQGIRASQDCDETMDVTFN